MTLNRNKYQQGFSLLELVIVILVFSMVMMACYSFLITTLKADSAVTEETRAAKLGEAMLSIIRRDLQGTIYKGYGLQVFKGDDEGSDDSARDILNFFTTATVPQVPENEIDRWDGEVTSVGYVLRKADTEYNEYILFRRVKWDVREDPLDGGQYYPIYEHIKSLSFRYLDRRSQWVDSWDASGQFLEGQENLTFIDAEPEATDDIENNAASGSANTGATSISGNNDPDSEEEQQELDPLILPLAVEIVLTIYFGDENGLIIESDRSLRSETFSTIVPLLVVDEMILPEEFTEDDDGNNSGTGTGGG